MINIWTCQVPWRTVGRLNCCEYIFNSDWLTMKWRKGNDEVCIYSIHHSHVMNQSTIVRRPMQLFKSGSDRIKWLYILVKRGGTNSYTWFGASMNFIQSRIPAVILNQTNLSIINLTIADLISWDKFWNGLNTPPHFVKWLECKVLGVVMLHRIIFSLEKRAQVIILAWHSLYCVLNIAVFFFLLQLLDS